MSNLHIKPRVKLSPRQAVLYGILRESGEWLAIHEVKDRARKTGMFSKSSNIGHFLGSMFNLGILEMKREDNGHFREFKFKATDMGTIEVWPTNFASLGKSNSKKEKTEFVEQAINFCINHNGWTREKSRSAALSAAKILEE